MVYRTGSVYEGEWVKGVKQGVGSFISSDGVGMMVHGLKMQEMVKGNKFFRMEIFMLEIG